MAASPTAQRCTQGATELLRSARGAQWRGPDAYDGLWFGWPAPLVGGRRRRQVVMQVHARSPVDVRRLYRRTHPLIPKALGIYASVGLRLGTDEGHRHAQDALAVLMEDRTAGPDAWGYHWDMQTRWSFYPAGSPNVVVTAFAAKALAESGAAEHRARALRAATWIRDALFEEDEGFFVYHPGSRVNIHNANLLGAATVHELLDDSRARDQVVRAVAQTLAAQRPDGSWGYGDGAGLQWADSFHTGYVLACLARLRDVDPAVDAALERGTAHYRGFFGGDGRASLWSHRRFPEDAHSAGTGLSTLSALARLGLAEVDWIERVAERTLMTGLRDGHAVYRRYGPLRTTVRYLRWADAHVALGLADAAGALAAA